MSSLYLGVVLAQTTAPRYDIILRHGTVVDGSGLPRYRADVGITGGYIAKVGDLSAERAGTEIDVTGLFVDGHPRTVTVDINGRSRITGVLQ